MNYYCKVLNIMGMLIKIEFREGDNFYVGCINKVILL